MLGDPGILGAHVLRLVLEVLIHAKPRVFVMELKPSILLNVELPLLDLQIQALVTLSRAVLGAIGLHGVRAVPHVVTDLEFVIRLACAMAFNPLPILVYSSTMFSHRMYKLASSHLAAFGRNGTLGALVLRAVVLAHKHDILSAHVQVL